MKILKFPDKALLTKCEDVTVFDEELKDTLDEMWNLMLESNGCGLAANQVGILKNFFIMLAPNRQQSYFINPTIALKSIEMTNLAEGCLSTPGEYLTLNRANKIVLCYQTHTGDKKTQEFTGIHAICIQHEIDHLLGKAFFEADEVPKKAKKRMQKKWGLV
ncbi:MAG TPA: peptide deformylase [Rhabdochlamydiaceae bacterium]